MVDNPYTGEVHGEWGLSSTAAARELPPPDFPMIATVVSTSSMETGAVEEAFFRTLHVLCHSVYRALSFAAAFRSLLHAGKREP